MKFVCCFLLFVSIPAFSQKSDVDKMLNDWHKAAAEGNFDGYFGSFAKDAVFIGTDASENWNVEQFKAFSKPYFDKGKAWDFKPVERHIYFSADGKTAWFDELLDTWMKICRGSGVLANENGKWKIKHYVLSMTVPNDDVDGVIKVISKNEDAYLEKLRQK